MKRMVSPPEKPARRYCSCELVAIVQCSGVGPLSGRYVRLGQPNNRERSWPNIWARPSIRRTRAFSPAVITQGGKTVWLAGQTATKDEQGNDISGNFEAQVRTLFSLIDKTLKRCGGSLANMVTMTVFITDPRFGDKFVECAADFSRTGIFRRAR